MIRSRLTAPAAERVILEGALYNAGEAKDLGLVDTIGEGSLAESVLTKMASYPQAIFASTKLLLRPRLVVSEEQRRAFREETIPYWASPERRASLLAMLEKRKGSPQG